MARSRLLPQLSANASYARNDFRPEGQDNDHYASKRQVIHARQPLLDLEEMNAWFAARGRLPDRLRRNRFQP